MGLIDSLEKKVLSLSLKKCEVDEMLPAAKNSLLCLHPSTMKRLKYKKGSFILLVDEEDQLLFRCWPCLSVSSSSVILPSWKMFCNLNDKVITHLYNKRINYAIKVTLVCNTWTPCMGSKQFRNFMKFQLGQFYVREDLTLQFTYLGYPFQCTVERVTTSEMSESETINDSGLLDICSDSNLDSDSSFSKDFLDKSYLCSTPISKCTKTIQLPIKNIKTFYFMDMNTEIVLKNNNDGKGMPMNKCYFENFYGLDKQIAEMKSIVPCYINQNFSNTINRSGIIFTGAPGTGKSTFVKAVGNEYNLPVFNMKNFICDRNDQECILQLKKMFKEASDNYPSILFLDDIDLFCEEYTSSSQTPNKIFQSLSAMIKEILKSNIDVIVIATASDLLTVDSTLRKPGTLEKEISFPIPSATDRKEILSKNLGVEVHNLSQKQISEIADITHGFTGSDLKVLCNEAKITSSLKIIPCICFEDIKEAMKKVKPSSVEEFQFESPNVKWSDIGGMHSVKAAITEMVDWPLKHSEQFKRFKITPSRGILLYGPPGCSKTMIAKALVSESHLNFISIKGPQLFNKYVGQSEKYVSDLFKKARAAAPCVLFFDEIDSLTAVRGSTSGNSKVAERILTQLLIEIDGVDVLQGVSIIAATNRPDMIDPSFLRPGRFDRRIYVPLPDAETRTEIFKVKLKRTPISSDVSLSYLVDATNGYTGAEICDLCCEAGMQVVRDYITSATHDVIKMSHFIIALQSVQPRTSKEKIEFYENYNAKNK